MAQGGGPSTGGVPKIPEFGWYKRRLPFVGPVPMPSASGVGPPPPAPLLIPAGVSLVAGRSRRAVVVVGRLPLPGRIGPRPVAPVVVRSEQRFRRGLVLTSPRLKPPVANVAGGVIPPFVVRRDYRRGAVVVRVVPPLKAPPSPVGGMVFVPFVRRWDFERAGLVYAERPVYLFRLAMMPPPVVVDARTWYACGRDNEWDSCNRGLKWSADVSAYLTKRSGETRQYTMDFSALPELQTANLAGVTSVTATALTVGASNVTVTSPALGADGKSATVWIAGGVSGARYKITFTVTITGGTVLEDFGYLLVEDE